MAVAQEHPPQTLPDGGRLRLTRAAAALSRTGEDVADEESDHAPEGKQDDEPPSAQTNKRKRPLVEDDEDEYGKGELEGEERRATRKKQEQMQRRKRERRKTLPTRAVETDPLSSPLSQITTAALFDGRKRKYGPELSTEGRPWVSWSQGKRRPLSSVPRTR